MSNVCDKKLQTGIELVTSEDMETLEQEMNSEKPHEFSKEFEQKMETLLDMTTSTKKSTFSTFRYMAATVIAVVMIGGFGFAGGAKLHASETNIPILQWMENFFVTEHDTDQMKGEKSIEVLFSQDQIGYLPEGFALAEEIVRGSKVSCTYENKTKDYATLEVYKVDTPHDFSRVECQIKKIAKTTGAMLLALNMAILPVCASNSATQMIGEQTDAMQARWNNIAAAVVTIGFRENTGYFGFSVTPYRGTCTGFDGQMVLYDENGKHLKSWTLSDFESPFDQERTYPCEDGKTYTVRFQGYAYGNGTMFDEIDLSVTDVCE